MKRGTASRVILGKNTIAEMPGGVFVGTDVILGKKDGLTNDFNGLVLSNTVMLGKKVSHAAIISVIVRGANRIVLPDAIANSLSYVKAFGGTEQRNLPVGYTELAYLETDGHSWFATGISVDTTTELEITASNLTSASAQLMVARNTNSTRTFRIAKATASQRLIGSVGAETITDANNDGTNKFTAKVNISSFYVDGTLIGNFASATPDLTGITEIDVFRGVYTSGTYYAYAGSRLHRATIRKNGVAVIDYIPARRESDGVLGMYDLANGQFYTNAGTGDFVAGPTAVPTPDTPMDIVSNNGVLKFTANEANYIADNVTLGYWLRNNDGRPEASPVNFYTAMMPVKPNTSYVCFGRTKDTNVISGYNRIAWYDSDGVWIRNSTYTANTPGIDTSPANAAFARFHCNPNFTEVTQELVDSYNWVFQQGTAEVPYTPYSSTGIYADDAVETIEDTIGNTATAEMLLKVGDYQDVQSIIDGVVTRNVGVKVLDGTEDWSRTNARAKLALTNSAIGTTDGWAPYCTHYQGFLGSVSIGNMPDNSCKINVNTDELLIKDATHNTDLATWRQFLADQYAAGTPVIIVYPLATPTTESVTGQALQVTDGDNVLEITQASLEGLELEAQYNTLVQLTVQEVENANLDNDVTVTIQ